MTEAMQHELYAGFAAKDARRLRASVRSAISEGVHECILHPLGFYFIRLATLGDTTIRLHYWPAQRRENGTAITPYHDHVWSLCSCILAGAIENVLLQLDPDEFGDFQLAEINQVGNIDYVVPASSRVRISVESSSIYRTGDFYEIPPRVFHYTNVQPEDAALTIVLAKVVVEGGPRTLVPVGFAGQAPARDPVAGSEHVFLEIACLLNN